MRLFATIMNFQLAIRDSERRSIYIKYERLMEKTRKWSWTGHPASSQFLMKNYNYYFRDTLPVFGKSQVRRPIHYSDIPTTDR